MAMLGIRLDKLLGSTIEDGNFEGKECKYIKFPLEPNGCTIFKEKYYYLNLWMTKRRINQNGVTHYLSLRYPKEMKDIYMHIKNDLNLWNQVKYIGQVFAGGNDYQWQGGKQQKEIDLDKAFEKEE